MLRLNIILFIAVLGCVVFSAEPANMPSLKMANAASGTLKICSKPLECEVIFQGRRIAKNRAVLSMNDVKAGLYEVIFEKNGARLVKKARVMPGETTILFGSLDSPEVVRIVEQDPLKGARITANGVTNSQGAVPQKTLTAPKSPVRATSANSTANSNYIPATKNEDKNNKAIYASTRMYNESAEVMFELAEILRKAVNPFKARSRYRRALELYRKIIKEYPHSPRVEQAHYSSGRIYESIYVRDYDNAVKEYRKVLSVNPYSKTDAAERVADLYGGDKQLKQQADYKLATMPAQRAKPAAKSDKVFVSDVPSSNDVAPITELTVESIKTIDAAGQPLARQ